MSDPTGPGDSIDWSVRDQPLTTRPVPVTEQFVYPPGSGSPNPPAKRRRIWPYVVSAVVLAILLVFGAGVAYGYVSHHRAFDVHGSLSLAPAGQSCYDTPSDIQQGTQVTVTAEDGTLLGVGQLRPGSTCQWLFDIADVPAGHRWYGITINSHGTVQFTEAEMRAGPKLGLS